MVNSSQDFLEVLEAFPDVDGHRGVFVNLDGVGVGVGTRSSLQIHFFREIMKATDM